jgi:hypothetical protein
MGVHRIVEQMRKVNPRNLVKIITPEKWLVMKPN